MTKQRTPGFFPRLLFKSNWSLNVVPDGLLIDHRLYGWLDLRECAVVSAFIWGHFQFEHAGKKIILRGMPRRLASDISTCVQALSQMLPAINALRATMASDRYVSNRSVKEALAISHFQASSWEPSQSKLIGSDLDSLRPDIELIKRVSSGNYSDIEERNDEFVKQEIVRFDRYFSSVEASVLSTEQRVATVVMEDSNLIIAAAGSGKTSVIVSKIGYLVKKGYAAPEEILVLSYNKAVAKEIRDRIDDRLVLPAVIPSAPEVSTFHAFGLAKLKEAEPSLRLAPLAQSSKLRSEELSKILHELIQSDMQFQTDAIQFIALYEKSGANEEANDLAAKFGTNWRELIARPIGTFEVPDPGSNLYATLSGDFVRSKQELQIANWLTLMNIKFEYEKPFPSFDSHPWTRDYRPDFYYPDLDLWHEHFGINMFGKAPIDWGINSHGMTYEQQVESKRQMLSEVRACWFETTSGDFETGIWEKKLRVSLKKAGANPQLISWEEAQKLFENGGFTQDAFLDLLGTAIGHFKGNHLNIKDLHTKAETSSDFNRSQTFVRLFEKIFAQYEARLKKASQIDFDDMLRIAAQRLRERPVQGRFKAVLVDEFQDMSNSRSELVRAVLHQNPGARLFAVGDDWQSIYRFAGSDIRVMTEFQKIFGFTRQVVLTKTFRCNQGLANLSSEFIRKNPNQINKSVVAVSGHKSGVVRVIFHAGRADSALFRQLKDMETWAKRRGAPADVCLLGRYNFEEPANFTALAYHFKRDLNLYFSTVHRSKGLGFDFIIVLNMSCKPGSDFPSTRQDDPLLSLFMPIADALPYAEERRLFYVALTRARRACVLLVPKFGASPFVTELLKSEFQESVRSLEISKDEELEVPDPLTTAMQQVCPACRRGRLLPRTGVNGPFMVCDRKERGFSQCKNIQGHGGSQPTFSGLGFQKKT